MKRAGPGLILAVVGPLLVILAWPSTTGPFYLDTEGLFRSVPLFRDPSLSWSNLHTALLDNPYPTARRPLATVTFLIENRLAGLTPKSGRIVNLLLHGLNMFLVYLVTLRVLGLMSRPARVPSIALLSSLLWGLNPFHADTVLYVIQRMTILSTTFYLLSVLGYLRARSSRGRARWGWALLALAAFGMGLASKENAVLVVLGILILELLFPRERRNGRSLLLLAAALVLIPAALGWAMGYDPRTLFAEAGRSREFTTTQRVLTEARVLVHYLSLIWLPLPSRLSFILKYPLSQGLLTPLTTLLSGGLIVTLVGAATALRRRAPLVSLTILWFFGNHLLESTVLPLEIAFPHRNYLPSIFLFLPLALLLVSRVSSRPLAVFATGLLLILSSGWTDRARVWGDATRFWEDATVKAPGSLRPWINLGVIYDNLGQPARAVETYREGAAHAYEETPAAWASVYCCAGIAYKHLGRYPEARAHMAQALSLAPLPDCLLNFARLELGAGHTREAHAALDRLQAQNPDHPKLHLSRAQALLAEGYTADARRELDRELLLFPGNAEALQLRDQMEAPLQ